MNVKFGKQSFDLADFNAKVAIYYLLALILFTLLFIAWRLTA